MEFKVWVDGIQRVVCGLSDDTTCHDVIIALANSMGQTGRFTLIEKWRDIERPLPPTEYPARALQKWGEYASEVKFHLCQSDSEKKKSSHERPAKPSNKFSHTFSPPEPNQTNETTIKRSSTFSGAHNLHLAPKSHRDQLASRLQPIVENRHSSGLHPLPHSSNASPNIHRSIPSASPRRKVSPHRTSSPLRLPSPRNVLNPSPSSRTSPHNIVRPLPNRPSPVHNSHNVSSKLHTYSNHEHLPPRGGVNDRQFSRPPYKGGNFRSVSRSPNPRREDYLAVEHTLDGSTSSSHSRSASLEIEEYDLDRNFPDILRDSSRVERPSVHTEYKLDHEVQQTVPESEHARLVRLVTVQLERIKTQESQIDMVDTEISSLEEKETEYEEELEKITTELLILEQRQREDEPDLIKLESTSWDEELAKSQKLEQELKFQIMQLKNKQKSCEKQFSETKAKETHLTKSVNVVKGEIKNAEDKLKKEESEIESETVKLQSELMSKQSVCDKLETELEGLNSELQTLESALVDRQKKIDSIEEELKDENIKSLEGDQTVSSANLKAENGETILKILEGRLSPKPNSNQTKLKTQQAFINSLSTKNPNGVWV